MCRSSLWKIQWRRGWWLSSGRSRSWWRRLLAPQTVIGKHLGLMTSKLWWSCKCLTMELNCCVNMETQTVSLNCTNSRLCSFLGGFSSHLENFCTQFIFCSEVNYIYIYIIVLLSVFQIQFYPLIPLDEDRLKKTQPHLLQQLNSCQPSSRLRCSICLDFFHHFLIKAIQTCAVHL